jgi:predicted PurR-regulated permease PerM
VVALDDRTGNILTTIVVFAAVVVVAFVARAALVVFVLALLLAYLLEPVVAGVERLLPRVSHVRGASIAVVYAVGALLAVVRRRRADDCQAADGANHRDLLPRD